MVVTGGYVLNDEYVYAFEALVRALCPY